MSPLYVLLVSVSWSRFLFAGLLSCLPIILGSRVGASDSQSNFAKIARQLLKSAIETRRFRSLRIPGDGAAQLHPSSTQGSAPRFKISSSSTPIASEASARASQRRNQLQRLTLQTVYYFVKRSETPAFPSPVNVRGICPSSGQSNDDRHIEFRIILSYVSRAVLLAQLLDH